ncbi:TipAS antibiotic-recognition domain-containing protein [Chimaeribacter arupi]|uniref:TipAS antibiotic-recognition domain-containing protein n=1 Tax=Yersiniaceae TaxID=1903411 RepID=UPI0009328356|nr:MULTISPECIES: TipAS antibiotic-recognition domain-containing protein [Yersiniaceae]MDV5139020.1 TipAS antibiotic-recognition domain-containing protein [Chimaeribacter arupi]PLR32991.1 hypothetical protein CYR23_13500 [Chimaeribacter arupi]PLR42256.1 hypothetical protein CYR52_21720 [Chimaeribacter arupi]WKZ90762.1 TipAS antibiotic-recognition domain-containing protein [Chimaeribacter arupi]
MYEKYFTQEELTQLPLSQVDEARDTEWRALVKEAEWLLENRTLPQEPAARQLALRWMLALERDTACNPDFLNRLNQMHEQEPEVRAAIGMTPEIEAFITRAFAENKMQLLRRYLNDDEYAFLYENYPKQMSAWPPLIADMRRAMEQGIAPESADARPLAQRWMALFCAYAGNDPQTHAKIRLAMEEQPELSQGTWLDEPLLQWLRQAVAHLNRHA